MDYYQWQRTKILVPGVLLIVVGTVAQRWDVVGSIAVAIAVLLFAAHVDAYPNTFENLPVIPAVIIAIMLMVIGTAAIVYPIAVLAAWLTP